MCQQRPVTYCPWQSLQTASTGADDISTRYSCYTRLSCGQNTHFLNIPGVDNHTHIIVKRGWYQLSGNSSIPYCKILQFPTTEISFPLLHIHPKWPHSPAIAANMNHSPNAALDSSRVLEGRRLFLRCCLRVQYDIRKPSTKIRVRNIRMRAVRCMSCTLWYHANKVQQLTITLIESYNTKPLYKQLLITQVFVLQHTG